MKGNPGHAFLPTIAVVASAAAMVFGLAFILLPRPDVRPASSPSLVQPAVAPRPVAAAAIRPELLPARSTADTVPAANYGPFAITCSPNSVRVRDDQNVQSVIDQHPPGTPFCFSEGEYRLLQALRPSTGDEFVFEAGATLNGSQPVLGWSFDGTNWVAGEQRQTFPALNAPCENNPVACEYEDLFMDDRPLVRVLSLAEVAPGRFFFDEASDKIYVRDDPAGHEFEATVTGMAFEANGTADVTVRGATIEKFSYHGIQASTRWRIEHNEIRYCHSHGLRVGAGSAVSGNNIHHNGNMGIFANGEDLIFDGNQLAYNNYLNFGKKTGFWHAGATKVTGGKGTVVRQNWSHHNVGDGWWLDYDNIDNLVEGNLFEDNVRWGLFYEISQKGVIRKNVFRNNAMGGLTVNTSRNVTVSENSFDSNGGFTIGLIDANRGSSPTYGTLRLANFYAHDNHIGMNTGRVGVLSALERAYSARNRFERNHYYVSDTAATWWKWAGKDRTWSGWNALSHDDTGSLERSTR